MSGPEVPQPDDHLLEEFLAGEGAVRANYRTVAYEQAPAHLDAAILQAAHAAARTQPGAERRRWRGYKPALATAAMLVLSFGVFLQVQQDPAAQREIMASPDRALPAAAPAPAETPSSAAEVPVLAESAPARQDAAKEKEQKPSSTVAAKPRPSVAMEKKRDAEVIAAAPAPAAPPPPPTAVFEAAAPSAVEPSAEPEGAAMAADTASAAGVLSSESTQRRERFAAAPMAKASRAAPMSNLMSRRDAPKAVVSDAGTASAIEQWAQSCAAEVRDLEAPTLWRGLTVNAWTQQANSQGATTTLSFAPEITREALTASLGSLANRAEISSAQCAEPMQRELRQTGGHWSLVCECRRLAER